ncbi:MAG: hypothetical protein AAGD14_00565 [Planctomycetota bacterium]
MAKVPRLYADFMNADPWGRIRLNCSGTADSLSSLKLELREGLPVVVFDCSLEADAVTAWSEPEQMWVAVIDWKQIRDIGPAS